MSLEVHLFGVELEPLASVDKVDGVSDNSRPIETLSESISDKSPWCRVVVASPRVYVLEELPAFLNYDAPLKNSHSTSSIYLFVIIVDDVGLDTSSNVVGLSPVFWEFPSN